MKGAQSNPVHYLANHSDLNYVDRGRRGELVTALLIVRPVRCHQAVWEKFLYEGVNRQPPVSR